MHACPYSTDRCYLGYDTSIGYRISPAERPLADAWKEGGDHTAYFGKWHLYGGSKKPCPSKIRSAFRSSSHILPKISECNIQNYSIYHRQLPNGQKNLLFSYFEYTGEDFDADMQLMADDPRTQKWGALCNPCQQPLEDNALGGAWVDMQEVFHLE